MHVALIEFRTSTPYPVQLANALGEHCQVTLMLPDTPAAIADEVDRSRVDLRRYRMPRLRQAANAGMVRDLRRQLVRLRPDLVHITFWHVWGSPGLGLFRSWPLVATVHDATRHPGDHGWRSVPSMFYPWQWRWADQVIVHASAVRQQLLHDFGCEPERVHVLPIGSYDFYERWSETDLAEEPNTVLFFGRIWQYKGLAHLIEAEPLIADAVPGARIIIAGYGESFDTYRRAMVHPERFEVHNYRIPDQEVARLFQRASVVVLPYVEASQSGVVPLAYAFGKPVVATQVGGLPDVVVPGQTGLLVPPGDSQSLAQAVTALLTDESRRRTMGARAREFAQTELSWSHIGQRTLSIYRQLLASAEPAMARSGGRLRS